MKRNQIIIVFIAVIILAVLGLLLLGEDESEPAISNEPTIMRTPEEQEIAEQIGLDDTLPNDSFNTKTIAEHNTAEDCWTIFESSVYDITDLLSEIGNEYAVVCGVDGTSALAVGFDNQGNEVAGGTGLSVDQRSQLGQYFIGTARE